MGLRLTPGDYLALRRRAAGLTIEDVAARVATEPRWAEHLRAEWIAAIEDDALPATMLTLVGLRSAYRFDFGVLAALAGVAIGDGTAYPQLCRVCGACADDFAQTLDGPCYFAGDDVCDLHMNAAFSDLAFEELRQLRAAGSSLSDIHRQTGWTLNSLRRAVFGWASQSSDGHSVRHHGARAV